MDGILSSARLFVLFCWLPSRHRARFPRGWRGAFARRALRFPSIRVATAVRAECRWLDAFGRGIRLRSAAVWRPWLAGLTPRGRRTLRRSRKTCACRPSSGLSGKRVARSRSAGLSPPAWLPPKRLRQNRVTNCRSAAREMCGAASHEDHRRCGRMVFASRARPTGESGIMRSVTTRSTGAAKEARPAAPLSAASTV